MDNEDKDDEAYEYNEDDEPAADDNLADRLYDPVNPDEVDDLLAEPSGNTKSNPSDSESDEDSDESEAHDDDTPAIETESDSSEASVR